MTEKSLTGDHPVTLYCHNCDDTFEVDETVVNDCPECGLVSMEIAGSQ